MREYEMNISQLKERFKKYIEQGLYIDLCDDEKDNDIILIDMLGIAFKVELSLMSCLTYGVNEDYIKKVSYCKSVKDINNVSLFNSQEYKEKLENEVLVEGTESNERLNSYEDTFGGCCDLSQLIQFWVNEKVREIYKSDITNVISLDHYNDVEFTNIEDVVKFYFKSKRENMLHNLLSYYTAKDIAICAQRLNKDNQMENYWMKSSSIPTLFNDLKDNYDDDCMHKETGESFEDLYGNFELDIEEY